MCAFVKLFLLYSCCVFISLWTSLSTRYFVCMTLYTLLTLVPFIGSQLQCTQSIALTYHLINYLGTKTWLREWYYNFWWDKLVRAICGSIENYVYKGKSIHCFINNCWNGSWEKYVYLRNVLAWQWKQH